jgi:putative transposase
MPRLARLVFPGLPHHVTQRGNRRQRTFFADSDYRLYKSYLAAACEAEGIAVWAWCLMPNHVHMILVPGSEAALAACVGTTHRRYARAVNVREGWTGHLWQGRFASFVMDEGHLLACARYVELNPVRAGLTARPEDWPWSSARVHLGGAGDGLVDPAPLLERWPDWRAVLDSGLANDELAAVRAREASGHPLAGEAFVRALAGGTGRRLGPGRPGRPTKK